MKIKTILAMCLFALSPAVMAGHGDCCSKHKTASTESHAHHDMAGGKANVNGKTCKNHDKMKAMSKSEHAGMNHAEHMKAMADTCHTDDCSATCEMEEGECMDAKCQEHCDTMKMKGEHAGH